MLKHLTFSLLILSVFMFISCKNSDHEITSEIEAVQQAKDLPKVETKIWKYLEDNPKTDGGVLFAKLAQKALALSSSLNAENYYIYAIREFPDSEVRYQNLYALSFLYKEHLMDGYAANLICCAMKQSEDAKSKQKGTSCCTGEDTSSEAKMEQLRSSIFNQETGTIDLQAAKLYIRSSKASALIRPGEKIAADHLNEAAKIAKATKDPMTAIELFKWLSVHFSNTVYGAKSLFLIAFTYENDLNDVENARMYYNQFIEEYPTDEFVLDAKLLLENLGKDPEEIIRQFEKEAQKAEQ